MRLPWRRGERASSLDLLVVGLGNPGREYARNRHNVGWMVVDELARRHGASWRAKFNGQLAEVRLDGHRVGLLKPETYMNESGPLGRRPRRSSSRSSPTPCSSSTTRATSTWVGSRRERAAGSPVTTACARSPSTSARRIFSACASGSGGPDRGDRRSLADYVLSDFEPHDDADAIVARAADAIETLDAEGLDRTQARFN